MRRLWLGPSASVCVTKCVAKCVCMTTRARSGYTNIQSPESVNHNRGYGALDGSKTPTSGWMVALNSVATRTLKSAA